MGTLLSLLSCVNMVTVTAPDMTLTHDPGPGPGREHLCPSLLLTSPEISLRQTQLLSCSLVVTSCVPDWPVSVSQSPQPQSLHRRGQLRSANCGPVQARAPASLLDIDWSGGMAGSSSAQSSSRQQYFTPSLQARSEAFHSDDNILLVPTETSVSEVDN